MPKSIGLQIRSDLNDIFRHSDRKGAIAALETFLAKYGIKYLKAVDRFTKHRDALLAFLGFPAEHWDPLRSTNITASAFATVRKKGTRSQHNAKLMVFKLLVASARTWRRLKRQNQLPKAITGVKL